MRRKRLDFASSLLLVILLLTLPLQGNSETVDFTINQAVQYLLENNRDFKKQKAEWDKARLNVRESASSAFPSVRLEGNYTRLGNIQSFSFDMDGNGPEPEAKLKASAEEVYSGKLVVEQTLFNGSVFGGIGVASSYRKAADYILESQKHKLIRDFLINYAELVLVNDLVNLQTEMVELTKAHLAEAELLHEIGAVDQYSLLRTEVEYLNSVPPLREAEKLFQASESQIKLMLNLDEDKELQVNSYDIDFTPVADINILRTEAKRKRPDIGIADYTSQAYKRAIIAYRAMGWPTLNAFYNYNRETQWDMFSQKDNMNNNWVAGLSLNIPIFNGFKIVSNTQKGKIEYQKSKLDKSILVDQIDLMVKMAYDEYLRSSTDFEAWFRNVNLADQGLEIATLMWENGDRSELELRDARLALKTAKVNLSQAKFNLLKAKIELLYALGEMNNINFIIGE